MIVATDYPGLDAPGPAPYIVGVSEARSVLGAVRSTLQLAAVRAGHRVLVVGDTQGGQAAPFTGHPPTDLPATEKHAATTRFAVESLLEAAAGYSAAYPSADLRAILTPRGRTGLGLLHRECDDQFGRATAGQAVSAAFSQDPVTTPPWSTGLAAGSAGPRGGTVDLTVFPALIAERMVRREGCRDDRDTGRRDEED